jgi:hypothetical protein
MPKLRELSMKKEQILIKFLDQIDISPELEDSLREYLQAIVSGPEESVTETRDRVIRKYLGKEGVSQAHSLSDNSSVSPNSTSRIGGRQHGQLKRGQAGGRGQGKG